MSANKTNRGTGETASLRFGSRKIEKPTEQSILLFDVERFPHKGYAWEKWDTNIIEFTEPSIVCSIAWQWYPHKEKFVLALPDFPGYDFRIKDDSKLIRAFAKEINKADIAIGHNIDDFDDKVVRTEAFKAGMDPLKPHRTIDTLKEVRKLFKFPSNKLEDICVELKIGRKVKHPGFPLWKACMDGDLKAFELMKRYNLGDVDPLLRGLFERIGPWMSNYPNMNVGQWTEACPRCKSKNLAPEGHAYAQMTVSVRFRCRDCGKWSQGRVQKHQGIPVWKIR